MWHHGRGFKGGGFFWIFGMLFVLGLLGKAGVPGFVIPLIFFWVFVPWFFSAGKRAAQPRPPRKMRPRIYPEEISVREIRPAADAAPARTQVVNAPRRDLSGTPAHCKACGGPVDASTVRWRDETPLCGYCGSGLTG